MNRRLIRLELAFALLATASVLPAAETHIIPLGRPANFDMRHVKADWVTHKGHRAIRITDADFRTKLPEGARLAIAKGTDFQDGTIEVDLTGDAMSGAPADVRGFTGIAFRVSPDGAKYEAIYLRPKNGRSEDQLQRNHSVQYMSIPEFPWSRLRREFPAKYETYVDLVPGEWTKMKIEVRGDKARLYVHGADQPTLIVNDLKHGQSRGAIALWIDGGVVAHFANLRVTR
jgi:hypothetical protein